MQENKSLKNQVIYTKSHSKHSRGVNPDLSSSRASALPILHRASKVMAYSDESTEKCFLRGMILKRHLMDDRKGRVETVQVEI